MLSFISRLLGGTPSGSADKAPSPPAPEVYETAEVYLGLRKQIFDLPSSDLTAAGDSLALVMETGTEGGCYSLVAVADGTASIYLSHGGGTIGAGEYEQVANVAKELVAMSKDYEPHLVPTSEYPLPADGRTRFYLVKKSGSLTAEALEDDLGEERLPLSPLFHKAHELIAYIRMAEEQRQKEQSRGSRTGD